MITDRKQFGPATVVIRGKKENIDEAINEINQLLGEKLQIADTSKTDNTSQERQEETTVFIDWQAAARESVS